jgi:hypothetical protein
MPAQAIVVLVVCFYGFETELCQPVLDSDLVSTVLDDASIMVGCISLLLQHLVIPDAA